MPNAFTRSVPAVLALLLLSAFSSASAARETERPNVILILIDDMGQRDLGCYGSTFYQTPHIDALAQNSVRFTAAYSACPVCSPTRASILTGKHPARLNLTDWLPGRPDRPDQMLLRPEISQHLPLEEVTLAERLHELGYASANIGKWHLGGEGYQPERQGFQLNIAGDRTGTPLSYFAPFRGMQGLEEAPDGEYLTDRLTSEALQFIERNRHNPFYLYLTHYAVHTPLRAKADVAAKYQQLAPAEVGQQNNPTYAAMVEAVDDSVGRILATLQRLQLDGRTIVIFTSDNGGLSVVEGPKTPSTINRPLREGKGYLYEGGIRVPLIVHWPRIARAGTTCQLPVCSIDLFPTILQMCGADDSTAVDGQSFVAALQGEPGDSARPLYWHYPHYSNQGGRPGGAIRVGQYKLIEFFEDGRRELFDLSDESESRNIILEQPQVAEQLAAELERWRRAVGARNMQMNPEYVPNPQDDQGTIQLHARAAHVHGTQLRYEPLPHKNTLGFWIETEDWASWDFTVTQPGEFELAVLQGCGQGQGGSEVEFLVADQVLPMTVEDTGHFQNFQRRTIGKLQIKEPGRHTLSVKVRRKAANAVMDLREATLQLQK